MTPTVQTCLGKPMLLSTIYRAVKGSGAYYREEPTRIFVSRSHGGLKLSNSLAGLIYCIITTEKSTSLFVKVDGEVVAETHLEALLWAIDNAPISLKAGVAALIEYEKVVPLAS